MVSVVKPDGEYDQDREPYMLGGLDEARQEAARWAAMLGLPIVEHADGAPTNVVRFRPRGEA